MEKVNRSYLVMLPKCQSTVQVGEFWPILLSTSISLRIVKVLVNRLREVILELVGPFQSSFIRGRQLVDCAIVAREIVEWKRKGTTGLMFTSQKRRTLFTGTFSRYPCREELIQQNDGTGWGVVLLLAQCWQRKLALVCKYPRSNPA